MKHFILFTIGLLITLLPQTTFAQEVTDRPICFTLRNTAPYKVYGNVATDYYTTADGIKARHTGNFRLEAKGTLHDEKGYPLDVAEFCSSGPFYDGRKMELTIRTLIPVFSCKTSIEFGEIVIHGNIKDDGTTKTWATCY